MTDIQFEIDFGTGFAVVPPPLNWQGLQIEITFTADHPSASLQATTLEWTGDIAQRINKYKKDGLTGGVGIFEGLPLRIKTCTQPQELIFDGVIDLANASTTFECDLIRAAIKESGRIDWLNDIAGSFSFAYLKEIGIIQPSVDYKRIPYVITEIPNYTQSVVMGISLFLTLKELFDVVKQINTLATEMSGDTTDAVATVGLTSASAVADIVKLIIYIIYFFLIIATLVLLLLQMIENIIQPKKYKLGMLARDHFIRACSHLGLNFSSTILNTGQFKDLTIIPRKTVVPRQRQHNFMGNVLNIFDRPQDENSNFPNNPDVHGHFDGTFRDFIVAISKIFNAEIKIVGNTLYFEEKHFWNNQSPFVIPNTGEPGFTFNLPDPHGINASELASNYFLTFAIDESELNTLHNFQGISVQVIMQPNIIHNRKNLLLTNLTEVRLDFAHAIRKENLTLPEQVLNIVLSIALGIINTFISLINAIINIVNWIISLFGGNSITINPLPTIPNPITARIGWLQLSNDSFAIPKLFMGVQAGSDWEIAQNDKVVLTAQNLMALFHGKNLATRGNQYLLYKDKKFKFCCPDYRKVRNNNIIGTPDGKRGILEKLLWDIYNDQAVNVDYRINNNFTNNLNEKIIVDGQ